MFLNLLKGTLGFIRGLFKSGAFHAKKGISQNIFFQVPFFLVLTSITCFRFTDFQFLHKHKKLRRPLLYQLFIKAVHISTMWTQTKWSRPLWLTNDKASYVAEEDSICLLSVSKEATLNKPWIKPCVPFRCQNVGESCSAAVGQQLVCVQGKFVFLCTQRCPFNRMIRTTLYHNVSVPAAVHFFIVSWLTCPKG